MSNSLEERLKTHSTAFDGLLSLIPAKYYYDDATQDQWQQKKKSKKDLMESKRAKFDPEADNDSIAHSSARDVMNSKGLLAKKISLPGQKVESVVEEAHVSESEAEIESDHEDEAAAENSSEHESEDSASDSASAQLITKPELVFDDKIADEGEGKFAKKEPKKLLTPEEQKKKDDNLAKLRERLSAKIGQFKEKRKAPGTKLGGAPKSREQILAERKKKDELKKQEKLKRKLAQMEEDEDESDSEVEAEAEVDEVETEDGVLFGNIVFEDGSRVTSDLTKLRNTAEKKKLKGPANNDIKAHIKRLEDKKRKLATLSTEDQEKQNEKDKWSKMMSAAEGVKVKDDEKLLKKALKRKDRQKLKSEIEWKERKQVVKDTVSARVKRRDENLKARRDNKGKKSKDQPRLKKFTGNVNKAAKKRAGFEGSAKSKNGEAKGRGGKGGNTGGKGGNTGGKK